MRELFVHKLVPVVIDVLGSPFPELKKDPAHVASVIRQEEEAFDRTIDRGLELFAEVAKSGTITGEQAFALHATYGFPIDLTKIIGAERGVAVDEDGFKAEMAKHKEISGGEGRGGASRLFELPPDALAKLQKDGVKATDDSAKFNAAPIGATVRAIWDGNRLIESTHGAEAAGQGVAIILDRTNFYAEMGGQVGDTGELRSTGGAVMDVTATRAAGGFVLHIGNMIESHLSVGDHVTATLAGVRPRTEQNHTATHLANWALREVLGEGVQQKGSLVDPDKLRFDFSHNKAVSEGEIERVEQLVNERVKQNLTVYAEVAPQEQALKINSLRAVFGEKYPPMVRVVSIGVPVAELLKEPASAKWREYSIEFCGGTHLKKTADVEGFVVTSEESVSKGIRRIVALTGASAVESRELHQKLLDTFKRVDARNISTELKGVQGAILSHEKMPLRSKRMGQAEVARLQAEQKSFEKSQKQSAGASVDVAGASTKLLAEAETAGAAKLVVAEVAGADAEQLMAVMDSLRKKQPGGLALLLGSSDGTKVSFCAAVSDDLITLGLKAGDWIRETAKIAGGGGGGRPNMAQAGGKDPAKLPDALARAREFAKGALK